MLVLTIVLTLNLTLYCAVSVALYNTHMNRFFFTNKIQNFLTLEKRSHMCPGQCCVCPDFDSANIYSLSSLWELHARHFSDYII